MLQVEGALIAGHAVEQHLQHPTEDTLLGLRHWHRLQRVGHRQLLHGHVWIYTTCWTEQCSSINSCANPFHTCTMISSVSRIIKLASVARLPSIRASCSNSALVLQPTNHEQVSSFITNSSTVVLILFVSLNVLIPAFKQLLIDDQRWAAPESVNLIQLCLCKKKL